ncbi:MAG: 30S ribosomal protein S3ae [Sulfolobales archaeon]|nr:30S ribosomal protein S3ae [Sulfolobales archaeon]MDW8010211.1 30S ribosomal protein S3ae [Sulfolobales archaeon]
MSSAVKTKWKAKKWYSVVSPEVFGSIPIGGIPADEDWKLLGRVVETTLFDLTGDFTKHYIHLYFQVYRYDEENVYTRFKGHELSRDYVKSITRRKSSKIVGITDTTTSDGYVLRVTGLVLTAYNCNTSHKRAIRKIIFQTIKEWAQRSTFDEFVKAMVFGDMAVDLMTRAKKIYPVRKAEIYKSKLLAIPTPTGPVPAVIVTRRPT